MKITYEKGDIVIRIPYGRDVDRATLPASTTGKTRIIANQRAIGLGEGEAQYAYRRTKPALMATAPATPRRSRRYTK